MRHCTRVVLSAFALVWLALATGVRAESQGPFAYPSSLMQARSTFSVSPATTIVLGSTFVELEHTRLLDVAAIAHAPIQSDGQGHRARQFICVQAQSQDRPVRLWFIASAQDTVTEVQLLPGTFAEPEQCGRLTDHFAPVHLSGLTLGLSLDQITAQIGPPSHTDALGWRFWVSRRHYTYDAVGYTEYVWLGALIEPNQTVSRIFTSQLTRQSTP